MGCMEAHRIPMDDHGIHIGDHGIPMGDHGIPMVAGAMATDAHGIATIARGMAMDDFGLPPTPMVFPWVTMTLSWSRGMAMDDQELPRTPMGVPWMTFAFPWVTMAFPWVTVTLSWLLLGWPRSPRHPGIATDAHGIPFGDHDMTMVDQRVATNDHGWPCTIMAWPWVITDNHRMAMGDQG